MLDTMKNERRGPGYVQDKFGVMPEQLGDVLSLMGDSVDNVPGVPGIGLKTASKLILEFGDLESVLAAAPAMKPSKMRDNLIEHADMARLSRELVELHRAVPLERGLDDFKLDAIPPEPLREFLEDQGFKSLVTRLGGHGGRTRRQRREASAQAASTPAREAPAETFMTLPPWDLDAYETVTTIEQLDAWIAEAHASGVLAIDTETDGLDSIIANLVGICLATEPGRACYIPVGHVSGEGHVRRADGAASARRGGRASASAARRMRA